MFKVTLFLLLAAAAAGDKPVRAPAPAPYTPLPTAAEPAVELVEDVAPAAEEVAAVEEAPVEAAAEAPAVTEEAAAEAAAEEPAAEEVAVEEVAAEEAVVEAPAEEPVVEEPAAEEPAATYPQRTTYYQPSYGHQPAYGHRQPSYGHPKPSYGHHQPAYGHPKPAYGHPQPAYGHPQPAYGQPKAAPAKPHKPSPPACAQNTTKAWCLEDSEYPSYELAHAVSKHYSTFVTLYQDVLADTASSVDRLQSLEEETYLCAGATSYVRPLRAQDTDGQWRVIVNGVQLHDYTFTQTARLEECAAAGQPCPLVPACYESTCLQKSAVHRMLIYDAYDHYSPFAIETFRLPSACACALGAYEISH